MSSGTKMQYKEIIQQPKKVPAWLVLRQFNDKPEAQKIQYM
jgi:hypothetical protein